MVLNTFLDNDKYMYKSSLGDPRSSVPLVGRIEGECVAWVGPSDETETDEPPSFVSTRPFRCKTAYF